MSLKLVSNNVEDVLAAMPGRLNPHTVMVETPFDPMFEFWLNHWLRGLNPLRSFDPVREKEQERTVS